MPTTSKSATSGSSTATDLAQQLATSQSATIYVDAELNEADAAALLTADPPLHVEHDAVRNLWAVRLATADEAEQAKAAAAAASASTPAPHSSTTA